MPLLNDIIEPGYCHCGCGQRVKIAPRTHRKYGWVKGEPFRFITGHHEPKLPHYLIEDRGYETPCWIWQRTKGGTGYAMICRDGRTRLAHRWLYEQRFGPVPDGLELDHLCRSRDCINVDHLEAVTAATNNHRGAKVKVNEAKVAWIRANANVLSQSEMARRLGVSVSCVHDIVHFYTWADI